jgi:hypothetical protein
MRTSLLHPIASRRHHKTPPTAPDITVRRLRDAGGPVDEACYPCSCGCFFIAPVSTSVACPHCGKTQAW